MALDAKGNEVLESEPQPKVSTFAAFRSRPFACLWLNSLSFALVGSWHRFAYVWLVLELNGGPKAAGLVTFALGIPVLFVALPAGVLSDRVDRRALMAASQVGAIAVTAITALLVWTGAITIGLTVALSFLLGAITGFGQPVRQAAIPSVVPRERLMNAIVLMSFVMNVSMIVGPALGGAIIAAWGLSGAFVSATVFYVVGTAFLLPLRLPRVDRSEQRPGAGGMREGFAFIARAPGIVGLFVMLGLSGILMLGPYSALVPPLARTRLHSGAFQASLLFTALGGGMFVASVILASLRSMPHKGLWFVVTLIPGGLLFSGIGLSTIYPLTFALMFVWGIGGGFFMNLNQTLIQSNTPPEFMGRVMSVHTLFFMGTTPIGGLIAGAVAGVVGAPAWVAISGILMTSAALLVLVTQPALRRMN